MSRGRLAGLLLVGLVSASITCSVAVRRDLSAIPPGQVGFDDMCGLQEYFDALAIKTSPPPRVVSALDLEGKSGGKRVRGGRERFAFENDFQLRHLRRILDENWRRLPDSVATASTIEIGVKWSEKAGSKRVITDEEAELGVGAETFALPYHVCLSELLYGEPLYRQRRVMWGLPLPSMPASASSDGGADARDGGAEAARPDAGRPDAVSRS
jgi:hypothetical protein